MMSKWSSSIAIGLSLLAIVGIGFVLLPSVELGAQPAPAPKQAPAAKQPAPPATPAQPVAPAAPTDPDAVAFRAAVLVSGLVEPARATALDKLDEGRQALTIATGWLRSKTQPRSAATDAEGSSQAPTL
jgi:hypothetical protein